MIGDPPLFASEVTCVLSEDGVVVISNALGPDAPYYLPTRTALEALESASSVRWTAVCSEAGWATWQASRNP